LRAQADAREGPTRLQPLATALNFIVQEGIIPCLIDADRAAKNHKRVTRLGLSQRKLRSASHGSLDRKSAFLESRLQGTEVLEGYMAQNKRLKRSIGHREMVCEAGRNFTIQNICYRTLPIGAK